MPSVSTSGLNLRRRIFLMCTPGGTNVYGASGGILRGYGRCRYRKV